MKDWLGLDRPIEVFDLGLSNMGPENWEATASWSVTGDIEKSLVQAPLELFVLWGILAEKLIEANRNGG